MLKQQNKIDPSFLNNNDINTTLRGIPEGVTLSAYCVWLLADFYSGIASQAWVGTPPADIRFFIKQETLSSLLSTD